MGEETNSELHRTFGRRHTGSGPGSREEGFSKINQRAVDAANESTRGSGGGGDGSSGSGWPWVYHGAAIITDDSEHRHALLALEGLNVLFLSLFKDELTTKQTQASDATGKFFQFAATSMEVGAATAMHYGVVDAAELSDAQRSSLIAQNKPDFMKQPDAFRDSDRNLIKTLAAMGIPAAVQHISALIADKPEQAGSMLEGALQNMPDDVMNPEYKTAALKLAGQIKGQGTGAPILQTLAEFSNNTLQANLLKGINFADEFPGLQIGSQTQKLILQAAITTGNLPGVAASLAGGGMSKAEQNLVLGRLEEAAQGQSSCVGVGA